MKKTTSSVLSPFALTALITRLTDHVIAECSAVDVEARFDDLVDELNRENLTGPFEYLRPSAVMKEMMPTDYRCGVADMTGTDDTLREIRGEYYDEKDVESARESFVADLQKELDDLEDGEATDTEDSKAEQIEKLEAMIDAASRHAF